MNLSLSTSWNSVFHDSGRPIIEEIKNLGFDCVELNFSLKERIVDDIRRLVLAGVVKVSSVHNFCPYPEELPLSEALPDCFSMSSLHELTRKKSVDYTKRSIATAMSLGAKAVVLHCGRVEIEDHTKTLMDLFGKGLQSGPDYHQIKTDFIHERSKNALPYFEQTLKSLKEISDYALKSDMSIGVENRIYYREIPSLDEFEIILDELKNKNVFYWHDTGHAQVYENLGFGRHEDFLSRYSHRMIGMHLHDVSGVKDHLPAGAGSIDFNMIKKYLKKDMIKVIETHKPATASDIKSAKIYLEKVFGDIL